MYHLVPGHTFFRQSILACAQVRSLLPPDSESTSVCSKFQIKLVLINISLLLTAQFWALSIMSTEAKGSFLSFSPPCSVACCRSKDAYSPTSLFDTRSACSISAASWYVIKDLYTQQFLPSWLPWDLNCTLVVEAVSSQMLCFQFSHASLAPEPVLTQFLRVLCYTFQKFSTLTN